MNPYKSTRADDERPSWYRPVAIALVSVALVSTGIVIFVIISVAVSMRSFGNK